MNRDFRRRPPTNYRPPAEPDLVLNFLPLSLSAEEFAGGLLPFESSDQLALLRAKDIERWRCCQSPSNSLVVTTGRSERRILKEYFTEITPVDLPLVTTGRSERRILKDVPPRARAASSNVTTGRSERRILKVGDAGRLCRDKPQVTTGRSERRILKGR